MRKLRSHISACRADRERNPLLAIYLLLFAWNIL
jgi:hypothetical protein